MEDGRDHKRIVVYLRVFVNFSKREFSSTCIAFPRRERAAALGYTTTAVGSFNSISAAIMRRLSKCLSTALLATFFDTTTAYPEPFSGTDIEK